MAFSFPYPTLGTVRRPPGQGCRSCVHKTYCMALYWMRREGQGKDLSESWTGPDDHNGIQCASWSSNPADMIKTMPTQTDLDENEYMYNQGIQSEADRNGITMPVSGSGDLP